MRHLLPFLLTAAPVPAEPPCWRHQDRFDTLQIYGEKERHNRGALRLSRSSSNHRKMVALLCLSQPFLKWSPRATTRRKRSPMWRKPSALYWRIDEIMVSQFLLMPSRKFDV